jgi:hypothetical protein
VAITKIKSEGAKGAFLALQNSEHSEVETVRQWFWDVMDQASGLYRWRTLIMLTMVAFILVVPLNFDAIQISNYVAERELNAKILETLITASAKDESKPADASKEQSPTLSVEQKIHAYTREYPTPQLPIGWTSFRREPKWFIPKTIGLLTSILAIVLCAPFLFDVLNRFSIVRFTVKPYERSSYDEKE